MPETGADATACAVLAARLHAQRHLGMLAMLCTATALLATAWPGGCSAGAARIGIALLALALFVAGVERYVMVRIAFDARLFDGLAARRESAAIAPPAERATHADLALLDRALAALGLIGPAVAAKPPRALGDRIAGTRRLLRVHVCAVLELAGIALAAVAWRVWWC